MKKIIILSLLLTIPFSFALPGLTQAANLHTFTADKIREASIPSNYPIVPYTHGSWEIFTLASYQILPDNHGISGTILRKRPGRTKWWWIQTYAYGYDPSEAGDMKTFAYGYNPQQAGDMKILLPGGIGIMR